MANAIWVIAEATPDGISRATRELAGRAVELAGGDPSAVTLLFLGDGSDERVARLAEVGAGRVLVLDDPDLATYRVGPYTAAIAGAVRDGVPEAILVPASLNGRELGASLAVALDTGVVQECYAVEREDGRLVGARGVFGGNLTARIECRGGDPAIFTVRPKAYSPAEGGGAATVEKRAPAAAPEGLVARVLELKPHPGETVQLEEADVIVAGGHGLGGAEGFGPLRELAAALGGAVGASRSAVDSGWIEYPHQVGQTGKTVQPKLYIACGISGAIQHIAGMRNADVIVAINKDPNAPIFKMADYGIVGDLFTVVPLLTQAFRESLKS
ncbi:MAG: electron transfer flavoprotein subunit alpha/FixB family protein [Candidatus Eisenbacteria bacterium]|nr:electron transfer flavoprotein subunit alpha/FixB family protein [Candidatus Eisenbacteria bacterium]